ncbi:CAZyme family GH47 [Penicillium chermesinum]|nr:CAZyme family GH47 [Penicillium chermesinum]
MDTISRTRQARRILLKKKPIRALLPPRPTNLPAQARLRSSRSRTPAVQAEQISNRNLARHREFWRKFPERFPVNADDLIKLPKGQTKSIPKIQAKFKDESTSEKQERVQQLSTVKAEFSHAWAGYKKVAFGHDELRPLSSAVEDPFNGWGATLVDALDTLWIMELKDEFSEAVDMVKKIDFTTSARENIPVFETVIRYLEKAEELAGILMGAFDTPNRMPVLYYRWTPEHVDRPHRASGKAALAEIGSLSLEFTRLAQLTKQDKYYDAVARITNQLENMQDETTIPGLWPMIVNAQGCPKYSTPVPPSHGTLAPLQGESHASEKTHVGKTSTRQDNITAPASVQHKSYAVPTDLASYLKLVSRDIELGFTEADAEPAPYAISQQSSSNSDSTSFTDASETENGKCDSGLMLPTASRDNKYTVGGMADSTYEYLPKEFLLLGGVNDQYKSMYSKAIDAIRKNLLFKPMVKGKHDIRFIASTAGLEFSKKGSDVSSQLIYEGHHLTCFVGGMVALGAKVFEIDSDMDLAAKLTDGCVWAYESTTTGIMPERFRVLPCDKERSCEWDEARYLKEAQKYSHFAAESDKAQFRTGESAYGQRVKLANDAKSQEAGSSESGVPLPMPGSLNPHDSGAGLKRNGIAAVSSVSSFSSAVSTATARPRPTGGVEPRAPPGVPPSSPVLGQTQSDHSDSPLPPPGMVSIASTEYLLRPEAIESVFIMYRLTGDDAWRQKGWKMFQAISKATRTDLANAAIQDVMSSKPTHKDSMESFWLAETLKYFYLLFSDPSVVDLDKYVLNTEAHPFLRPL